MPATHRIIKSSGRAPHGRSYNFVICIVAALFIVVVVLVAIVVISSDSGQDNSRPLGPSLATCKLLPRTLEPNLRLDTEDVSEQKVPPSWKRIWLLWYQGWEHAPWLCWRVAQSWARHNSTWCVQLVSKKNLDQYIDTSNLQNIECKAALSDVVRLRLLDTAYGVWADATMLCMMPLDTWVDKAVQPVGVWMYHGRDGGRGPATWFIISSRYNYIMRTWRVAADEYWSSNSRRHADSYFWMDGIFMRLLSDDSVFAEQWQRVPFIDCNDDGQSHCLAGKVLDRNPDLQTTIYNHPPFAIKLSRHFDKSEGDVDGTNLAAALDSSFNPRWSAPPKHIFKRAPTFAPFVHNSPVRCT